MTNSDNIPISRSPVFSVSAVKVTAIDIINTIDVILSNAKIIYYGEWIVARISEPVRIGFTFNIKYAMTSVRCTPAAEQKNHNG